ncbi:MAG: hypothetical protein BAJALOKI2v1_310035 [Promethearchaeota archaeon]|nr:MAG: hypothetical protein BAJALOKI2v1_310035 [Candidatus Lokiarchaeota archaeon]
MINFSYDEYYNRVLGSWLGRVAGDHVGGPLEFRPYHYIKLRYNELTYYPKKVDITHVNDDEMYEICALLALEKYYENVDAKKIAWEWITRLYRENYTAEKIALQNLRRGIAPPESGKLNNIYFDAIGAQMRADIWGQLFPASPELAKKYAEMDGSISHEGIGIEGEVFIAALISNAFIEDDIRKCINKSFQQIPPAKKSLYTQMIKTAIRIYRSHPNDFRGARKKLIKYWHHKRLNELIPETSIFSKRYLFFLNKIISGVHVLPNIGIIILALLYGTQDKNDPLGRSICIATMMGLDTDCNAGNVGAIIGAQIGAKKILNKWKKPLQNTFRTYVKGYEKWKITDLAERIAKVGLKMNKKLDRINILNKK